MKQFLIGVLLTLTSNLIFACSIDSAGYCPRDGKAYFKTHLFPNNAKFQFRYANTQQVILEFTTKASGSTDTVFGISQVNASVPIEVQFRFKDVSENDNHYTGWGSYQGDGFTTSALFTYAGCGTLAVGFNNLVVQHIDDAHLRVQFESGNTSNVDHWEVASTTDGTTWVKVGKNIMPVVNQSHYDSGIIGLYSTAILSFALLLLIPKLKRRWLVVVLAFIVIGFSCTKSIDVVNHTPVKAIKVTEVRKDGASSATITRF